MNNHLCDTLEFMEKLRRKWHLERFSMRLDDLGLVTFIAEQRLWVHQTSLLAMSVEVFQANTLVNVARALEYQFRRDGFKLPKESA